MDRADREKIKRAIRNLMVHDRYLLENNATERCIVHKFAEFLQKEYEDYNVDCEYNLNIENENDRKVLHCIEQKYNKVRKVREEVKRKSNRIIDGVEYLEISVFPDIIIHQRGSNKNKIIIEVKKSTNSESEKYDLFKLMKYTEHGSEFKHQVGIFIKFFVGRDFKEDYEEDYEMKEFCDGSQI